MGGAREGGGLWVRGTCGRGGRRWGIQRWGGGCRAREMLEGNLENGRTRRPRREREFPSGRIGRGQRGDVRWWREGDGDAGR